MRLTEVGDAGCQLVVNPCGNGTYFLKEKIKMVWPKDDHEGGHPLLIGVVTSEARWVQMWFQQIAHGQEGIIGAAVAHTENDQIRLWLAPTAWEPVTKMLTQARTAIVEDNVQQSASVMGVGNVEAIERLEMRDDHCTCLDRKSDEGVE